VGLQRGGSRAKLDWPAKKCRTRNPLLFSPKKRNEREREREREREKERGRKKPDGGGVQLEGGSTWR